MKNLAIILARKGSKRLKSKNYKKLNGKPLIYWTIKFARSSKIFEDIIVSTDSNLIKNFSLKQKVICPWLRPKKLSTDKIKSEAAALHALNWYEKKFRKSIDCVTLLQPTSPFRLKKTLSLAYEEFKKNKKKNIVTVSRETNIFKKLFVIKNKICVFEKKKN